MNENVRIVRVVPGGVLSPKGQKPQLPPARILFDPPNQESVLVAYCRGDFHGLFDAMVEDIEKNNHLLRRHPVRHNDVDGHFKSLNTDTPLPQEWLDEHGERVEIFACSGGRRLDDLQYTLRW